MVVEHLALALESLLASAKLAMAQLYEMMGEVSAGLVSYGFENAGNVPQLDTRVRWHVRVLGNLVECRDGVGGANAYGMTLCL